jgi:hypothetical protein
LDELSASKIVWLDALLMNMDRTARNTNMLMWRNELWLIDHGAALYFHHSGNVWDDKAKQSFALIKNHVLLKQAKQIEKVSGELTQLLNKEIISNIINQIPDVWLESDLIYSSVVEQRLAYGNYLMNRIQHADIFVKEVLDAQK